MLVLKYLRKYTNEYKYTNEDKCLKDCNKHYLINKKTLFYLFKTPDARLIIHNNCKISAYYYGEYNETNPCLIVVVFFNRITISIPYPYDEYEIEFVKNRTFLNALFKY